MISQKIKRIVPAIMISALLVCGCGKSDDTAELEVYRASIDTFCENVAYIDSEMNQLDGSNSSDVKTLLSYLDTLEDQFLQLSELEAPEEFAVADDLADSAYENMSLAVSYYHQAYEDEIFNQNYADAALEYYKRATSRVQSILQLLRGEEIEDKHITYTTEEVTKN